MAQGIAQCLPNARIGYHRFHIVALANEAMDDVSSVECKTGSARVNARLAERGPREQRSLPWVMRHNPQGWSATQTTVMRWLRRANLESAQAWRPQMALRQAHATARSLDDAALAPADPAAWISWPRRSRLETFKPLAATLRARADAVVHGMLDDRGNAFVEAMNGPMQQAKRADRGFRTTTNFIHFAYLRLSKLTQLPASPFAIQAVSHASSRMPAQPPDGMVPRSSRNGMRPPLLAARQALDRLEAESAALKARHAAIRHANAAPLPATRERVVAKAGP